MSADTEPVVLHSPVPHPRPWRAKPPRLWPAVAAVVVYWAVTISVGRIEKSYFVGFIFGLAAPVLLALFFLGWWWLSRRIRLSDRLYGFLVVVAGWLIAWPLAHPSVGFFGLLMMALPVVLTVWTLWMLAVKWWVPGWYRPGALVVVAAAWGFFLLVRHDGLDSDLRADLRWRWSRTAEEIFLAERAAERESRPQLIANSPLTLRPGDWSEFRGPARDGVIAGVSIATDWNKNPPRPVWRHRVGPAWSSVIVVDGRLFTQEQHGDTEAVVCYDADTGKELWSRDDPQRFWESVSGAGPRATPTFVDGRLYTLGATGVLNCLDAASGSVHWSRNIAAEAGAKPPMWGCSGSPLVVDGLVIAFAGGDGDNDLVAYRAASGEPVWTAATGAISYSSPQLATLAGKPQCLMLTDRGLTSVDPATGQVLWKTGAAMPGAPRTVQPRVVGPTQLLVGTLDGAGMSLIDVTKDGDHWNVSQRWTSKDLKPEFPDYVVHQGHAYGFDRKVFCCIDLSTGKRTWEEGRYGRGQVMVLPDQSLLLVVSEGGEIVLLKADAERHEELDRFQAIKGKTWNHPVIAHGRLYVRNAEEMACYELAPVAK
ncbi:MAG TPA: PQQ-binding-like beta-propeller repeat protein [Gemmataceae bacterium]|nr:PQQ-binding-like beta-propeller repeat protein [Gemmataceae bacterium]